MSIDEDLVDMRDLFEQCATLSGKITSASIMHTYDIFHYNKDYFEAFAIDTLKSMPKVDKLTPASEIFKLLRRLRCIKIFSKMLKIDVSVTGMEVATNLVDAALDSKNVDPDVLRELSVARFASERYDQDRCVELCRTTVQMKLPSELSSKIAGMIKKKVVFGHSLVSEPHTIKRCTNGVTFLVSSEPFWKVTER